MFKLFCVLGIGVILFYPIYRLVKKLLIFILSQEDIENKKDEFNKIKSKTKTLKEETKKESMRYSRMAKEYRELLNNERN